MNRPSTNSPYSAPTLLVDQELINSIRAGDTENFERIFPLVFSHKQSADQRNHYFYTACRYGTASMVECLAKYIPKNSTEVYDGFNHALLGKNKDVLSLLTPLIPTPVYYLLASYIKQSHDYDFECVEVATQCLNETDVARMAWQVVLSTSDYSERFPQIWDLVNPVVFFSAAHMEKMEPLVSPDYREFLNQAWEIHHAEQQRGVLTTEIGAVLSDSRHARKL